MILDRDLIKMPLKVSFAGLRGNTVDLVRSGWELSFHTTPSYSHYSRHEFCFSGRHSGLGLMLQSAYFMCDDRVTMKDGLAFYETPILIEAVARTIMVRQQSSHVTNWDGAASFDRDFFDRNSPIQYGFQHGPYEPRMMTMATGAFEAYAKFKSIDNSSDIFIPKEELWTMEKHLDAILKAQQPKQDEIRKRILNERERGVDSSEVKLQLLLVS